MEAPTPIKEKKVVQGKPWTTVKIFDSYEAANNLKNSLLKKWEDLKEDGIQVKIKLRARGYIVKKRLHPDFEPIKNNKKTKKGKKSGKNSRTDSENTN